MHRSRILGVFASAFFVASADAQPPTPPVSPELHAAAQRVMAYLEALPGSGTDVVALADHYMNAPRADVRAALASGRAGAEKAAADLAALPLPAAIPGFDMTFVLAHARAEEAAAIEAARAGIDAIEKMMAAQDASDCVAHQQQERLLEQAQNDQRRSWGWSDTQSVQSFLASFAGVKRPLPPAPAAPSRTPAQVAADDVRRNGLLADNLAFHLRCPFPDPGLSFEIDVVLPATTGLRGSNTGTVRLLSISDESQRTPIELRFRSFTLREPGRFYQWGMLGKPLKFQWSNQHMRSVE